MSLRRAEMLKEMGLTPLWRLRPNARIHSAGSDAMRAATALRVDQVVEATLGTRTEAAAGAPVVTDDRRAAILRMDWTALREAVARCVDCTLHKKRNKTVFGVGDENADWMFIGEGPGADEDAQGDPFVGQAGRLLDNMLAAVDLARDRNVYIANVVKCRPPGNRNPEPDEAQKCEAYLQRQIELIRPKLIIALGRVAALNLLARDASIASLRGRVLDYKGTPLIVTYHPAYLLRTPGDKAKAWEDLCFAVKTMQSLSEARAVPS
jgi:DNA polymerase